jgi:parallel beta-helix repeat protein
MANNFFFAVFSRGANDVVIDSLTVNKPVQGITNWGGSNWQITNNEINETGAASGGGIAILVGGRPPDYSVAQGNLVKNNMMTPAATAPDFTCPAIAVSLDLRYGGYEAMTGNEDVSYNQIVNNDITGTGLGSEVGVEIGVIGVSDDPNKIANTLGLVHDNLVRNNIIENTDWGIYFYTVTDLMVLGNEIVDCNDGVHIEDSHKGTIINYNAIHGSESYGLNNTGTVVVDAELNWWGDVSGPNDPDGMSDTDGVTCYDVSTMKNDDGLGDVVTQNADYCPWLMAPVSPSDAPYTLGDLNYDGCVNFQDVAILADEWLEGCE